MVFTQSVLPGTEETWEAQLLYYKIFSIIITFLNRYLESLYVQRTSEVRRTFYLFAVIPVRLYFELL